MKLSDYNVQLVDEQTHNGNTLELRDNKVVGCFLGNIALAANLLDTENKDVKVINSGYANHVVYKAFPHLESSLIEGKLLKHKIWDWNDSDKLTIPQIAEKLKEMGF